LTHSPPIRFVRTGAALRKDFRDHLTLNYVVAGGAQMDHSGHTQNAGPGELLFLDHGRAGCYQAVGDRCVLSVHLGREAFGGDTAIAALFDGKRFAHHKLAPLLKMTLAQLAVSMQRVTGSEIVALVGMVESLVSLIARDKTIQTLDPGSVQAFQLIEAEISRDIHRSELSPKLVAQRLGVSVRHLQRIMMRHRTTFSDYVREKRLTMAMRRLQGEKWAGRTIEEVAYGSGFSDISTFYRAFNSKFKCRPGDIRQQIVQLKT